MLQDRIRKFIIALTLLTTVFTLHPMEARAWWCCMYPEECFETSVRAIVYEDGQRKERDALTEDDYQEISVASKYKAKSYFLGDGYDKFFSKAFH